MALAVAAVTALAAGNPDVKTDLAAAVQADIAPSAKGDRSDVRPVKSEPHPVNSGCPQEPWPYGCQWRVPPARKVLRGSRPS